MDTIAAVCTGTGAVGILRISGKTAKQVASRVFSGTLETPRVMVYGAFYDASGAVVDRGLAVWFQAPNSYTGEDVIELHCHGSAVAMSSILEACFCAGARAAKPGEFTKRAFLNGKMDLTQAEAVVDLIDAETEAAAKSAVAQLDGEIGKGIDRLRDRLLDIAAAFSAYVDYPEDGIDEPEVAAGLNGIAAELERLAASYTQGKILKDGIKTALIGRPNVGKSSLLNALVGFERSIVTDTAGTTRDTIEETALVGGVKLRLVDTAGMRETQDLIEREGVSRSTNAAERAELLLCVFDVAQALSEEDFRVCELAKNKSAIAVINKGDLVAQFTREALVPFFGENIVEISAKEHQGLEDLGACVARVFSVKTIPCDGSVITNARHMAAVKEAGARVREAETALNAGLTPDVAVGEIEQAIVLLGEITGKAASDAVLTRIFERFCVGK